MGTTGYVLFDSSIVVIKQLSDFPVPINGVITLEDNKTYLINGIINLGTNKIVCGISNSFFGFDRFNNQLIYTGVDSMITIDSSSISKGFALFNNILFNCANGSLISSIQASFRFEDCSIIAKTLGTVSSGTSTTFRLCGITNGTTNGISFSGSCGSVRIVDNVISNNEGIAFDLGTATFTTVDISRNTVTVNASQTFLKGTADGANITISGLLSLNSFNGAGTYIDTITAQDSKWIWTSNIGLTNTVNGNSQPIQTTSDGKYPALDGSLITNISGGSGLSQQQVEGII